MKIPAIPPPLTAMTQKVNLSAVNMSDQAYKKRVVCFPIIRYAIQCRQCAVKGAKGTEQEGLCQRTNAV